MIESQTRTKLLLQVDTPLSFEVVNTSDLEQMKYD